MRSYPMISHCLPEHLTFENPLQLYEMNDASYVAFSDENVTVLVTWQTLGLPRGHKLIVNEPREMLPYAPTPKR